MCPFADKGFNGIIFFCKSFFHPFHSFAVSDFFFFVVAYSSSAEQVLSGFFFLLCLCSLCAADNIFNAIAGFFGVGSFPPKADRSVLRRCFLGFGCPLQPHQIPQGWGKKEKEGKKKREAMNSKGLRAKEVIVDNFFKNDLLRP